MGKNQQHKAMQRSRHGSGEEGGADQSNEEGRDVSFHTPAWHAARLAALTVERVSYEDWKKQKKDEEAARQALAVDEEKQMQDYRAQLDADRAQRLSRGTNHADKQLGNKGGVSKHKSDGKRSKHKKDKHRKEKTLKKAKKRRHSSSSPSSSSIDKNMSMPEQTSGPVRLSEFLRS